MRGYRQWVAAAGIALFLSTGCSNQVDSASCIWTTEACESDHECEIGECVANPTQYFDDLAPLSLVCGCTSIEENVGAPCEGPDDCSHGICLITQTCSKPCSTDAQCNSDERCIEVFARTSPDTSQPFLGCVKAATVPDDVEVDTQILPAFFTASDKNDQLDLPAISPTSYIVLEHQADDAWPAMMTHCRAPICIRQLVTNDEASVNLFDVDLFSQPWTEETAAPLNPVASGSAAIANQSHPITIMIPNSPLTVLSESGYVASIESEKEGDLRITTLQRTTRGERLNLNLFYVGGLDLTPEGERGPTILSQALSGVEDIFSQAEISIGDIRQYEILGGLRERFEYIDQRFGVLEQLPYLFSLSAGAENAAVNLFFVREIYETLAISGGTPGPLGLHGTHGSGIAFSTDLLDDATKLTKVIAHELGHFLGLFHLSEMAGFVLDPLPDTEECRLDRDENQNGRLDPEECEAFGVENLMFWAFNQGTKITPDQADILRSAPILE